MLAVSMLSPKSVLVAAGYISCGVKSGALPHYDDRRGRFELSHHYWCGRQFKQCLASLTAFSILSREHPRKVEKREQIERQRLVEVTL